MTILRTKTTRLRMLVALALAGATLSACSPAPDPSPAPTAAFASEEEAFAAAEEVYRAYMSAFNEVDYGDPKTFITLDRFTDGDYASEEHEGLSQMHAEGIARGGTTETVWFRGIAFDGDLVTATACNDVSAVTLVDASGESIVSPDRPDRSAVELTFSVSSMTELVLIRAEGTEIPECSPSQ